MAKLYYCHNCSNIWSSNEMGRKCSSCFSDFVEQIQEETQIINQKRDFNIRYGSIPNERLLFFDETGLNLHSIKNYGYAPANSTVNFAAPSRNKNSQENEIDGETIPVPESSGLKSLYELSEIFPRGASSTSNSEVLQSRNSETDSIVEKEKEFSNFQLSTINFPNQNLSQTRNSDISSTHTRNTAFPEYIEIDSISQTDSSLSHSNSPHKFLSRNSPGLSTDSPPKSFSQIRNFLSGFHSKPKGDKFMNKISLPSTNFTYRDDCSICLKNYMMNDFVRITQCGHKYHEACLKSWLKVKKECPICRSQFK